MSTLEQKPAAQQFDAELKIAHRLLNEDGFYQLRDKVRTTEQVHKLAHTVVELTLRLEALQKVAESQRVRADTLEDQLEVAKARGFDGPESSYAGLLERIAELERTLVLLERQLADERERMESLITQRQAEWDRADTATTALQAIVDGDLSAEEMRAIANGVLA